jgi:flagellin-like protein
MRLKQLFTDDDAVSPVIGVILMVAITVILAAVIGAFVLGFGGGGPSAPSVQWDGGYDNLAGANDQIYFDHGGGDTVDNPATLTISGSGASTIEVYDGTGFTAIGSADNVSTGDYVTSNVSSPSGDYTLIWESPDGDSSQELATYSA